MAEPIQALTDSRRDYLHGAVDIAPGVVMAEGVILGAAAGCRLVISTGVCLGGHVIIQAIGGDLVIEPGANLGSGVLVTGQGRIGYHVCIGADSTVINPTIAASQVIPPRSLWGDPSQDRLLPIVSSSPPLDGSLGPQPGAVSNGHQPEPEFCPRPDLNSDLSQDQAIAAGLNGSTIPPPSEESLESMDSPDPDPQPPPSDSVENSAALTAASNGSHVYGKKQVNQLLNTLFPHRQSLNGASSGDKP